MSGASARTAPSSGLPSHEAPVPDLLRGGDAIGVVAMERLADPPRRGHRDCARIPVRPTRPRLGLSMASRFPPRAISRRRLLRDDPCKFSLPSLLGFWGCKMCLQEATVAAQLPITAWPGARSSGGRGLARPVVPGGVPLLAVLLSTCSSVVTDAASAAIITATAKSTTAVRCLFRSLFMREPPLKANIVRLGWFPHAHC